MGIYHKPERTILKFDLLNSSIYNTGGNKHAEYMYMTVEKWSMLDDRLCVLI